MTRCQVFPNLNGNLNTKLKNQDVQDLSLLERRLSARPLAFQINR